MMIFTHQMAFVASGAIPACGSNDPAPQYSTSDPSCHVCAAIRAARLDRLAAKAGR